VRLPVFARKAKRKLATHRKFFFFDVGVYRAVRPRGPLDTADDIEGAALETLVFQELRALNDGLDLGTDFHYWRTTGNLEVDLVLYGERGLKAFEVKRTSRVRSEDLKGLRAFIEDYPMAEARLVYGGTRRDREGRIEIIPAAQFFSEVAEII